MAVKYYYDGMTLRQFCQKKEYVYPTMKTYIQNILKENPNLSRNEVALKAVAYYEHNHVSKEKYFYKGERLVDYCKRNNLNYKNINGYLSRYVKDSYNITDKELERAIYKYNLNATKDSIRSLDTKETLEDCAEVLNTLKIDLKAVRLVMNFDVPLKEAILFVWYFGKQENGIITLQAERIQEVYHNLYNLDSLELNELIGYYKTNLKDTRDIIYKKSFLSIRKIVSHICNLYNIEKQDDREELKAIADSLFINVLENTTSRYLEQIVSYMNHYIEGCLKKILLKEKKESKTSLNEYIFDSPKKKEKIENITGNSIINREYISEELLAIIKELSPLEQQFILMKYQIQYDEKEIAQYLHVEIKELEELNVNVLEKLRKRKDIKNIYQKRKIS